MTGTGGEKLVKMIDLEKKLNDLEQRLSDLERVHRGYPIKRDK